MTFEDFINQCANAGLNKFDMFSTVNEYGSLVVSLTTTDGADKQIDFLVDGDTVTKVKP